MLAEYMNAALKQKNICLTKAFVIKSVCVVALVSQHVKRIFSTQHYTVRCCLSGPTTSFHIISQTTLSNT
jgi:hypothetical protein